MPEQSIELNDQERGFLLVALGMAMATAMTQKDEVLSRGIRRLVGKIAPESYWGLKPEEEHNADA